MKLSILIIVQLGLAVAAFLVGEVVAAGALQLSANILIVAKVLGGEK